MLVRLLRPHPWLVTRFKVAWGAAREQVRIARGLEAMPATRRALEEGEVSMSAVRVLVSAREADPEAFTRGEETLVEASVRVAFISGGSAQRIPKSLRDLLQGHHQA